MEQGCNGLTYINDIASPWRHEDAFLYTTTTALLYSPHSTAVNELGRRHHKQVEVFEALGVTGDNEVGSRLKGGEILHGIFKVCGTRSDGMLYHLPVYGRHLKCLNQPSNLK